MAAITREQRNELERLAKKVFAEENVGQVIVGKHGIAVYLLKRNEPLLVLHHPERGLEAAMAALRIMAGEHEPCPHQWEEAGRDLGAETDLIFQRCSLCGEEQTIETYRKCEHGHPWGACTVKDCLPLCRRWSEPLQSWSTSRIMTFANKIKSEDAGAPPDPVAG